jgi:hypothetical protein
MLHVPKASNLTRASEPRIFSKPENNFPARLFPDILVCMALLLRPISDDSPGEYDVVQGELKVGHIYKRDATLRPEAHWMWTLNGVPGGPDGLPLTGFAESRNQAEAALSESWEQWLAWAGLSEASGAAL